jgi:hypothetical protein
MCACKKTDEREYPTNSTVTGREGHESRGEMCHPHYRENPVSSLGEHGVFYIHYICFCIWFVLTMVSVAQTWNGKFISE